MQIWASDQPYVAGDHVHLPLSLSPSRGTIILIWEMCAHVRGVKSSMSLQSLNQHAVKLKNHTTPAYDASGAQACSPICYNVFTAHQWLHRSQACFHIAWHVQPQTLVCWSMNVFLLLLRTWSRTLKVLRQLVRFMLNTGAITSIIRVFLATIARGKYQLR